jgi:hypothetical protein
MKLREFWVPIICNLFLWRVYQPPRQKGVPSGAPLILRPQRGRWIASIVFLGQQQQIYFMSLLYNTNLA